MAVLIQVTFFGGASLLSLNSSYGVNFPYFEFFSFYTSYNYVLG